MVAQIISARHVYNHAWDPDTHLGKFPHPSHLHFSRKKYPLPAENIPLTAS